MTEWHLNTEFPEEPGYYLITELDTYCGTSKVWQTNAAFWDGELWERDGVLAWAVPPFPFYTDNEDILKIICEQAYKNNELYCQRKASYEVNAQ